eukprot:gene2656-26269_t
MTQRAGHYRPFVSLDIPLYSKTEGFGKFITGNVRDLPNAG